MGRKLYVGNLPYSATDASVRTAFSAHGTVETVNLITDRDTGQQMASMSISSFWRTMRSGGRFPARIAWTNSPQASSASPSNT